MKKLKLLPLNLQQTLVYEDSKTINAVQAVHDKHKKLLVIHPVLIGHSDTSVLCDAIYSVLSKSGLVWDNVIFGDGFTCDTWNNKIKNFPN